MESDASMATYGKPKFLTIGEVGDMATLRDVLRICEISVPIYLFHTFLYPFKSAPLLHEHQ